MMFSRRMRSTQFIKPRIRCSVRPSPLFGATGVGVGAAGADVGAAFRTGASGAAFWTGDAGAGTHSTEPAPGQLKRPRAHAHPRATHTHEPTPPLTCAGPTPRAHHCSRRQSTHREHTRQERSLSSPSHLQGPLQRSLCLLSSKPNHTFLSRTFPPQKPPQSTSPGYLVSSSDSSALHIKSPPPHTFSEAQLSQVTGALLHLHHRQFQ